MSGCDECRRGLLRAGLAGAVSLVVPGCGDGARGGARDDDEAGEGDAADPDAVAEGGGDGSDQGGACNATCAAGASTLTFAFSAYPQLRTVGGSAVGRAAGYADPSCRMDVIIVVQVSAGNFAAFSAACPHQCCTVSFDKAVSEFVCPCHGSTFNEAGRVTGGPAPRGLTALPSCVDGCGVHVAYG